MSGITFRTPTSLLRPNEKQAKLVAISLGDHFHLCLYGLDRGDTYLRISGEQGVELANWLAGNAENLQNPHEGPQDDPGTPISGKPTRGRA